VVAIIAILAAMLLPALNRARDAAKAAGCVQNMKQIGLAWAMYASDNEEWFLYVNDCANSQLSTSDDRYWYEMLTPYTEGVDMFLCPKYTSHFRSGAVCGLTFARGCEFTLTTRSMSGFSGYRATTSPTRLARSSVYGISAIPTGTATTPTPTTPTSSKSTWTAPSTPMDGPKARMQAPRTPTSRA